MDRGLRWLAPALIAVLGCGRSEPEPAPVEGRADPRPAWQALLGDGGDGPVARAALFEPAVDGDAADDYRRATGEVPAALSDEVDAVLSGATAWDAASPALRELAGGELAGGDADAILAGASRTVTTPWLHGDAAIMRFARGPARLALLAALADGAAGRPAIGARRALAVARLAQDLTRGDGLGAAMTGRAVEGNALDVLRSLAAHPALRADDLRQLLATDERLEATRPDIADAMVGEIDATARRILADESTAGMLTGSDADTALANLLEQRRIAHDLGQLAARPLPAQRSWFETRSCKVSGGARTCKLLVRYLVAAAMAEAHARATRIAMAAELRRRSHQPPPLTGLADLVPEPLTDLPGDPISGQPFELTEVDGVRVIRRAASPLDGEPGAEPRDVRL